MDFLHIDLQENDSYQAEWSGNAGATRLVLSNFDIEGANDKARVEGYIVASYDADNNLFLSTDVPEPVVVNLEGGPAGRMTSLEFEDFDELEVSLTEGHERYLEGLMRAEIIAEADAEMERLDRAFAANFINSGAKDLEEYKSFAEYTDLGLLDERQEDIIRDIHRISELENYKDYLTNRINSRLQDNDQYVDMDVSRMESMRSTASGDIGYLKDRYDLNEEKEQSMIMTQDDLADLISDDELTQ